MADSVRCPSCNQSTIRPAGECVVCGAEFPRDSLVDEALADARAAVAEVKAAKAGKPRLRVVPKGET